MNKVPPIEIAELCYSTGWRDKNLIIITAICGAESQYQTDYVNTAGTKIGLFGLTDTEKTDEYLFVPENSVKLAREIYEDKYFNPWHTFTNDGYRTYLRTAISAVADMFAQHFDIKAHFAWNVN